jgi:acetyl esterase
VPASTGSVTVVYFHGGGFIVGGLQSHDDICAEIAERTGCKVISVDYRLCPEHIHPAAYEDSLAAAQAALAKGPVILAGDSAGGNLAAALAQNLKGDAIKGQVLIYPGLGGDMLGLPSYTECVKAPMLPTRDIQYYRSVRSGGPVPEDDPTFFPLAAKDFSGLAPCFISAAGVDPLRDDGVEYVRRLIGAGVTAYSVVEPQLPHGHLRARTTSHRAREAFGRILDAIREFAA